jgi:hypothetical protein
MAVTLHLKTKEGFFLCHPYYSRLTVNLWLKKFEEGVANETPLNKGFRILAS